MKNYFLKIAILLLFPLYALWGWIFSNPYSSEEVEKNWHLAQKCDGNALDYLGDYYEKIGDESQLHSVLAMQKKCSSNRSDRPN